MNIYEPHKLKKFMSREQVLTNILNRYNRTTRAIVDVNIYECILTNRETQTPNAYNITIVYFFCWVSSV